MTMSSIFFNTRTITRRRSQGPAPGLSLSIILTLLSMCGTKIASVLLASTSWLENVCYLAKEILNVKLYKNEKC
jgi:hypothetical protein